MINIRPVSDLRNNYTKIEEIVTTNNQPVYLTKNGHGIMVIMSLEQYTGLTTNIEQMLDEAEVEAEATTLRLSHEQVFKHAREVANADKKV